MCNVFGSTETEPTQPTFEFHCHSNKNFRFLPLNLVGLTFLTSCINFAIIRRTHMVRLSLKMDEFEYLIFVKFQFLKVFSFKMLLNIATYWILSYCNNLCITNDLFWTFIISFSMHVGWILGCRLNFSFKKENTFLASFGCLPMPSESTSSCKKDDIL